MTLSHEHIELIRQCSRDEQAFERMLALYESLQNPTEHVETRYTTQADDQHPLGLALKFLPAALYVINTATNDIVFNNQRIYDITGYKPEFIQQNSLVQFLEHLLADHTPAYLEHLQQRLATATTGEAIETELEYRHASGETRWLCLRHVILSRHANGAVEYLMGIAQDITSQKQGEFDLKASESRYRSVITALSEGIVIHNTDGEIINCNAAAERILGLSADQIAGRTSYHPEWRVIHEDGSPFEPEDHPAVITLRTHQPVKNVIMGVRREGNDFAWISINAQPIFRDDSTELTAVVASFSDITIYKTLQSALEQNQENLQMVVEGANLGTWNWDISSGTVLFNTHWAEMLGYRPGEIEPNVSSWERLIHPDDKAHVTQLLDDHLTGHSEYYQAEHRLRCKDGSWLWVLDRGQVFVRDADGKPLRAAGIHLDITQNKLAEQQKLELTLEKHRMEILSSFIQDAAHEFRTPLSIIQTSAYLMERSNDAERRQDKGKQIQEQIIRIEQLVHMLSLQSRLDSGLKLNLTAININDLIEELADKIHIKLRRADIFLRLKLTRSLPTIIADREWLIEGLLQVLDNAVRYSPAQSLIIIRSHHSDGHVVIEITDGGSGIPEADLPHIFDRFFRKDTPHSTPGLGLGLSLARSAIEKHNGTITLQSELDTGTTAIIRLPDNLNEPQLSLSLNYRA